MDFMLDTALPVGLGAAIGFCIGLTGVGGGVLVVPALTVVLGFKATLAVGTATAFSALSKVLATFEHGRLGNINLPVAGSMLAGAVPAAVLVALFVKSQAQDPAFQYGLGWLITAAIGVAAALMALRAFRGTRGKGGDETGLSDGPTTFSPLAAGLGVLVGALLAATSVGGGVIIMPMLVFAFSMKMRRVIGTAIVISLVLSLVASLLYHFAGSGSEVDWAAAGWLFVGSLVGIRAGSRLTARLTEKALLWASIAMITTAVVAMTLNMLAAS